MPQLKTFITVLSVLFICDMVKAQSPLNSKTVFNLKNESVLLENYIRNKRFVVLIAHGIECPVMRKNLPTFNKLYEKYSDYIAFILVNGVKGETPETINKEAEAYKIKIPIIKDNQQELLKTYGLSVLSGLVLIDTSNNEILYSGAVDDRVNLDVAKAFARKKYLEDALNNILAKRPINIKKTQAFGCKISIN